MLEITDFEERGARIVEPVGRLDTLTAKTFETHLKGHVENGDGPLLVNMMSVDYVSSFGLRSILIVAKQLAPSGRKFVLYAPNPSVLDVLRISGFLKIVAVADTKDAALAEAGGAAGAAD